MGRAHIDDDRDDSNDIGFSETDDILDDVYTLASDAAELASTQEDSPSARSITSRCRIREQLERDMQAYLQHGGSIHHLEQGAAPPSTSRYLDSDYGLPFS